MSKSFSHIGENGDVTMVNVEDKNVTLRRAIAKCSVVFNATTFALLEKSALPKGDVLTTAKIAGIMATKQTSSLIPMCHPLALSYVDIRFIKNDSDYSLHIESEVCTEGKTGVEVEALMAVQIAALTVYDMCKAVQKDIIITECHLVYKNGGKSGEYRHPSWI